MPREDRCTGGRDSGSQHDYTGSCRPTSSSTGPGANLGGRHPGGRRYGRICAYPLFAVLGSTDYEVKAVLTAFEEAVTRQDLTGFAALKQIVNQL